MAVISPLAGHARAREAAPLRIALTFDDLPAHGPAVPGESRVDTMKALVAALRDAGAPPSYGFINGIGVQTEPDGGAALDAWRAGGNLLGNHTWSHVNANQAKDEVFLAEVAANEPLLERRMKGQDWRWLRYPFLAEGKTPAQRGLLRSALADRGYKIAAVTLSFNDWAFSVPYARCRSRDDQASIALMERMYLDWARASLSDYRSLAQAVEGRDIPYVLLLHGGPFTARMLPRLLAFYKAQGARFVPLPQAERDPFYSAATRLRDDLPAPDLRAAALRKHVRPPVMVYRPDAVMSFCR